MTFMITPSEAMLQKTGLCTIHSGSLCRLLGRILDVGNGALSLPTLSYLLSKVPGG